MRGGPLVLHGGQAERERHSSSVPSATTSRELAGGRETILFVEDDEQLDKALEVRDTLPLLRRIVVFDMEGLRKLDDPGIGLRANGRRVLTYADLRSTFADPDGREHELVVDVRGTSLRARVAALPFVKRR